MRKAATTPMSGWCGQIRSRMTPTGIDQSMAHAVLRQGTYTRARFLMPVTQAIANGRTSSGIVHGPCTRENSATGTTQVATAKAAARPGRFWATATNA
jgi:hypothetical protein